MAYKFQLGDARLSGSLIQEGSIESTGDVTPGDDVIMNSDGALLKMGADQEVVFTHSNNALNLTVDGDNMIDVSKDSSATAKFRFQTEGQIEVDRCVVAKGTFIDNSSGGSLPDSTSCAVLDWHNRGGSGAENKGGGRLIVRGEDNSTNGTYTIVSERKDASNTLNVVIIDSDGHYKFHDGAHNFDIASHDGSNGLKLGGTLVSATAAEINLLDGGTAVGSSITLADSDGIIVDDGGVMKKIPASDVKTFLADNSMNVALKDNGNTLVNGINYFADLGGNEAANLPASPDVGDAVYIKAPNNCSSSSTLTINKQGSHTIDGLTSIILESPNAAVMLVYVTANTWKVF